MNQTMMNRNRARWMKENEKGTHKKQFKDLSPQMQQLIYWTTAENKAALELQDAEFERLYMYQIGFTAETFDFSEINENIIRKEYHYHECRKQAAIIRKYFEENK